MTIDSCKQYCRQITEEVNVKELIFDLGIEDDKNKQITLVYRNKDNSIFWRIGKRIIPAKEETAVIVISNVFKDDESVNKYKEYVRSKRTKS